MPALLKKHVDAAEPVDRGLHVSFHVGLVADVGLDGQHALAAAERVPGSVQAGLVDVDQRHRRAFLEEACRRGLADAAGAAGDDDDFVLHAFHAHFLRFDHVVGYRKEMASPRGLEQGQERNGLCPGTPGALAASSM
jgi:hypothetical protein